MTINLFQFHREMSAFPPVLHARVNGSDHLYAHFRDELFDPTGPPLREYIAGLDPDECPLCDQEPVYSYAHPDEEVGLYVSSWELSTPCLIHGWICRADLLLQGLCVHQGSQINA